MTTTDWSNNIIINKYKNLDIYILPKETSLYRGDIQEYDNFGAFNRPIAWFGNYSTAGLYGPIVEYKLNKESCFFAIDTPNNIKWLQERMPSKELAALKESFQIRESNGESYVFRTSEPLPDIIVANFLCHLFEDSLNGWIHLKMRSFNLSGFMGPEVMICNPSILVPVKTHSIAASELAIWRHRRRPKNEKIREHITFMSRAKTPDSPPKRDTTGPTRKKLF